ncbi:hypothetical protein [Pseudomonas graminis]
MRFSGDHHPPDPDHPLAHRMLARTAALLDKAQQARYILVNALLIREDLGLEQA